MKLFKRSNNYLDGNALSKFLFTEDFSLLGHAFTWDDTLQGYHFWSRLRVRSCWDSEEQRKEIRECFHEVLGIKEIALEDLIKQML